MVDEIKQVKWDERYINMAKHIASWTSCIARGVGAVIVRDRCVLTTGYNGAPSGFFSCKDLNVCHKRELGFKGGEGHHVCRAVHAEMNAILQASMHGIPIKGAHIYVTTSPCQNCAAAIVNSGITKVIYDSDYINKEGLEILEKSIEVVKFEQGYNRLPCWTPNQKVILDSKHSVIQENCGTCLEYAKGVCTVHNMNLKGGK